MEKIALALVNFLTQWHGFGSFSGAQSFNSCVNIVISSWAIKRLVPAQRAPPKNLTFNKGKTIRSLNFSLRLLLSVLRGLPGQWAIMQAQRYVSPLYAALGEYLAYLELARSIIPASFSSNYSCSSSIFITATPEIVSIHFDYRYIRLWFDYT